jgi:phytoene dehydrogenase-like protein
VSRRVLVVGAGVGGLAAALRLAQAGLSVRVLEARAEPGGLASQVEAHGLRFDGGPYVLLDRPGLDWAFAALGIDLSARLPLRRLLEVYEVASPGQVVRVQADLEATAAGFERISAGAGDRYRRLVEWGRGAYARLTPALFASRPGPRVLLGAWRELPLLLSSLSRVLARTGLPPSILDALAIWTHVAGQDRARAPAFMALLPALIHGPGAFYPEHGFASIPGTLFDECRRAGVEVALRASVRAIRSAKGRIVGVETEAGLAEADAVVSDVGVATYLELLAPAPAAWQGRLARLPLQSPGVCAYLAVRGTPRPPYLRFRLDQDGCRVLVAPRVVVPGPDPWPARLIAPLDHGLAARLGRAGQEERLDSLLEETWWRDGLDGVKVVARRVPATWGSEFRLHRDAMNPVMTARLMRKGRLAHRSPFARGLYLCGSATHPGQWVSFCAVSGVLAADLVRRDLV